MRTSIANSALRTLNSFSCSNGKVQLNLSSVLGCITQQRGITDGGIGGVKEFKDPDKMGERPPPRILITGTSDNHVLNLINVIRVFNHIKVIFKKKLLVECTSKSSSYE